MKSFHYSLVITWALLVALIPTTVHADTISTFTTTGTFAGGASLTGTITIDTTVGTITALNLSATGNLMAGPFSGIATQGPSRSTPPYYNLFTDSVGGFGAVLSFATSNLTGYIGGPLCTLSQDNCPTAILSQPTVSVVFNGSGDVFFLTSGQLSPEAQGVPEPSCLLLLGSGLTGWFVMKRTQR